MGQTTLVPPGEGEKIMQGPRLLARFLRAQSGNYVTLFALAAPFIIGGAGIASEGGMWLYQHNDVQAAADSAALSAANARTAYKNTNMTNQANSVTTSYGYSNGVGGTTVVVNSPPTSGSKAGNNEAVEVIVTIQQPRLLTKIFFSNNVTIR